MAARILLTRPLERGNELLLACRARGFDVCHLPLQTLFPIAAPAPASQPIPAAIIVVSVTAAQLGAKLLPQVWQQQAALIAVGRATADALAEQGWPKAQTPAQENSEALLQLSVLQNVAGQRVLLLRGEVGRELISDTLQARGAQLESLLLYRSGGPSEADAEAIRQWAREPGIIVLSSTQALAALCAIIPLSARSALRLLCLGSRIAAAAQAHFEHVSVISKLTAEAINDVL